MPGDLLHRELTRSVIGAFYEVYNHLGFGLLEPIYANALERELVGRGHRVLREVLVRVYYKGEHIGWQRLDMVVDDTLIVEIKSTRQLHESARRQLLCYLRVTRFEVGLLLHFGPKARFHRLVNQDEQQ